MQKMMMKTRAGAIIFDGRKVAFLPQSQALLIADMHFEKGSYLREFGRSALPAYDTRETIERLAAIVEDYQPKKIIALGDSFHDPRANERLDPQSANALNGLSQGGAEWIWILGNHDPDIPEAVFGVREDHVDIDGFLLTHHPHRVDANRVNICGHYHPKAKVKSRNGSVSAPCFAVSDHCIIMPSFGTFTGGLFVSHADFQKALPDMTRVVMTYESRLFPIKQ